MQESFLKALSCVWPLSRSHGRSALPSLGSQHTTSAGSVPCSMCTALNQQDNRNRELGSAMHACPHCLSCKYEDRVFLPFFEIQSKPSCFRTPSPHTFVESACLCQPAAFWICKLHSEVSLCSFLLPQACFVCLIHPVSYEKMLCQHFIFISSPA